MLAVELIQPWHWAGFIIGVCFFLALDLGLLHREAREIRMREAVAWTACWFILAMMFAVGLLRWQNQEAAGEFVTGYIVELALSMDNVFVIAMIFSYFGVAEAPSAQGAVLGDPGSNGHERCHDLVGCRIGRAIQLDTIYSRRLPYIHRYQNVRWW
jgi:hypothetical protein